VTRRHPSRENPFRRGAVLIVAMLVVFALAGITLVLCRSMRVEMLASANAAAALQASAIQRGAEQYVLGVLAAEGENVPNLSEDQFAAVRVGGGYFWILRPQYDENDGSLPVFGLTPESGKLNLNSASYEQLMMLPGATEEIGSAIMEWRDGDETIERMGPESEYYLSLPEPYYSKNSSFETIEELLLVRGIDPLLLYGDGSAPPLGQSAGMRTTGSGGVMTDPELARGWYNLLTIRSREPNNTPDGESRIELDNVNRGSRRTQLQNRLRERLGQQRADQVMSALRTDDFPNIFAYALHVKLEPSELDLLADDLRGEDESLRGRININAAPRAVLACINGLSSADVDKLLARRESGTNGSIGWVLDALGESATRLTGITGRSYQYTADILAVSGNGRAFKRCRIIVDIRSGSPRIVYRRDLTDDGWPMDRQLLADIRAGQYQSSFAVGSPMAAAGGGFSR
jgi:type II secretory pathway component PulK